MTEATAITTVEELPAELRAELVAKREAGTTLAELKKAFPQVAPDVIRAVLPPLPKGTEAKPAPGASHWPPSPPRRPPRAKARAVRRLPRVARRSRSRPPTAAPPTRSG